MKFSIVIPAHNGEKFLAQTLRSVLEQTRQPDEILLIDDASRDATAAIACSPEFSGQIKYIYNAVPTGFADAWNRAVAAATGDFVTILHQDDLLDPEYLAQVARALTTFSGVRHVFSTCRYIDADGGVVWQPQDINCAKPTLYSGREYAHAYLAGVASNQHLHRCPGVTTERRLLLEDCTYRKEAGHIADDDFFLRVGGCTEVVGILQPLASYRIHSDSTTSRLDLLSLKLARDYLFQVEWYQMGNGLLDYTDIQVINRLAVRFVNLLLFQSLHLGNVMWRQEALRLREELERLLPGFTDTALPVWARLMWYLSSTSGKAASVFARLLHGMIRTRDLLRGSR